MRLPRLPKRARDRIRTEWRRLTATATRYPRRVSAGLILVLVLGLTVILLGPQLSPEPSIAVGQPSPQDYEAPQRVTYVSEVLTERERQRVAADVPVQFEPVDRTIAGQQRQRAREVLAHIGLIRADPYATSEEKLTAVSGIPELSRLGADPLMSLIDLDGETWDLVVREVPAVIGQTLREPVRPNEVPDARSGIVGKVDRELDASTAQLVADIAADFVVANTAVDEEMTEAARQAAREAVPPVERSFSTGETIVRAGDRLTEEHVEALRELRLVSTAVGWRDVVALGSLVAVIVVVTMSVLQRLRPETLSQPRLVALFVVLVSTFALGAQVAIPGHAVIGLAYPSATVAMTLAVLFGLETGLAAAIIVAFACAVPASAGLEMAAYVLVGSLAGAVVISRIERLSVFLVAGVAVAAAGLAVLTGFRLTATGPDVFAMAELVGAAVANAALSTGLATLCVLAVGALTGVLTSLQLLELARPDHALLKDLQVKAPGTYQHSLVLANMAERAAAAIGADPLLVRVGSYYHDVGKTQRPYFFIENQMSGVNPHDGLDPRTSAAVVIEHVPAGAELARRHRLPERIIDFIWQHHGTTRVEYFYHRAVSELGADEVDVEDFRYPGPRPQSRETAIVMLADGAEAAVRAAAPDSIEQVEDVVEAIFTRRLEGGQLADSDLTLRDLSAVRAAFLAVLRSMYHPRIKYPDGTAAPKSAKATAQG